MADIGGGGVGANAAVVVVGDYGATVPKEEYDRRIAGGQYPNATPDGKVVWTNEGPVTSTSFSGPGPYTPLDGGINTTQVYGQAPGIVGLHMNPNDPGYNDVGNPELRKMLHPEAPLVDPAGNPGNQRFKPPPPGPAPTPFSIVNNTLKAASGATDDTFKAQMLRDQLTSQINQPPRTAPQVPTPPTITPAQAGSTTFGPAVNPTASLAGPTAHITAPTVGGAQGGPATTYQASHIAETPGAVASQVTPAQLDAAKQDEIRRRQVALLQQLEQAASGSGPTAASAQMQKNVDQAIGAQRSLAAGVGGTGSTAAQLGAARNIGTITGQGAADSAMLRAKEIQDARTLYDQSLQGTRGLDINFAGQNASLANAAGITNAQLSTNVSISNADRLAARAMKQADLEQAAAAGNAAAQNELNIRNAEMRQQQAIEQARVSLGAATSNQGTDLATALANARAGTDVNIAGAAGQNARNIAQGGADLSTTLANAGYTQGANIANASNTLEANSKNATLEQNQMTIDDQRKASATLAALQAQNQVLTNADAKQRNAVLLAQLANDIKQGNRTNTDRDIALVLAGLGVAKDIGKSAFDYFNSPSNTGGGSSLGDFLGDSG